MIKCFRETLSKIMSNWGTVSYFVLFFFTILISLLFLRASWGEKSSADFGPSLFLSILSSLIASGVLMIFITFRDSARLKAIDTNIARLAPLGDKFDMDEVTAVLRNHDVSVDDWLSLISELETDRGRVFFVGTGLKRWRERHEFSKPLIQKLKKRLSEARLVNATQADEFSTYFCLADSNAIECWQKFIRNMVLENKNANLEQYRIKIVRIPASTPYAAVCSSKRLGLTLYTVDREVDDSLAIFMPSTGSFYDIYVKDIAHCINEANRGSS